MKKALMIISLILMGCSHQNIADNKSFVETCIWKQTSVRTIIVCWQKKLKNLMLLVGLLFW